MGEVGGNKERFSNYVYSALWLNSSKVSLKGTHN